jgi:hypothetical protein
VSIPIKTTLDFAGGGGIAGLSAATAAGQPLVYEQRGAAIATVALTVASIAMLGYAEVVVSAVGVTPTSRVIAAFSAGLDEENDIEELADSAMAVIGVPETDQIRFVLTSANGSPFVGLYNIDYQVAA